MSTYTPEQEDQLVRAAIEAQARQLVVAAKAAGFHVEIAPRPLKPLAMRNYEMAVTVWPVRQ